MVATYPPPGLALSSAINLSLRFLFRRPLGEVDDARVERLGAHEFQTFRIFPVLEEALPTTKDHGMNHEPELV